MSRRARSAKGATAWLLPNKKKPFAYSTVATKDLIVTLAEEYETIQEVYNAVCYDSEARQILAEYIARGYGANLAREFFRR